MDSRSADAGRLATDIAMRAAVVAGLIVLTTHLLATTHFYATALLLIGIAIIVTVGIAQVIGRVVRIGGRDLERLVAEGGGRPNFIAGKAPDYSLPVERAAAALSAARAERQQQLDYLSALVDTTPAILIVVAEDGQAVLANRAARTLSSQTVSRLEHVDALGPSATARLLALEPGAREIVTLADGRQMFVSVASFTATGREPRRLLALQSIAGELDAVELKAWQDMAHVLAHEMMNSLTPIASLSESLESLLSVPREMQPGLVTNPEVAGALEAIKRRSRGLMDFVERYRTFADLPLPRPERIAVATLLRSIETLLAPGFAAREITYRLSVVPETLSVDADPQLLEQAIINLLRNAAEAVLSVSHRHIDVTCTNREGWVVLEIADTGPGIGQDGHSQVFVPFFTTKPGGSGIGLSLARKIALSHRGRLDFHGNYPQGAVFSLALPAIHPENRDRGH